MTARSKGWALLLLAMACVPEGRPVEPADGGAGSAADGEVRADAAGPGDGGARVDGGSSSDAGPGSDAATPGDAGDGDSGALIEVSHERQFRAVWIATAANINFPSSQSLSAQQQQAELRDMVDVAARYGLNAIVFQVRPESDAFYASALEPWSRFLSGTQGTDPGYDPLGFIIDEAHARGLELHAWFNPYRAKINAASAIVAPHIALQASEFAYTYDNQLWMDPAADVVRQRTVDVIRDVATRYAVDGIHFDDYFYPYPDGTEFPDDATWNQYVAAGGAMSRGDWRRQNVHDLVQELSTMLAAEAPAARFGISPFGIYRPGMPAGISGLDQYTAIFSDPVRWIDEGWLDYLAPQLYWPSTQTAQAYGALIQWWTDRTRNGTYIFSGNFLSRLGDDASWSVDEFRAQLDLNRMFQPADGVGEIFFQIAPLVQNRMSIGDVLVGEYYGRPALTPPLVRRPAGVLAPPLATVSGRTLGLSHPDPSSIRFWVVYREEAPEFVVDRIVDARESSVTIDSLGRYAVTASDRFGRESQGRSFEIQ